LSSISTATLTKTANCSIRKSSRQEWNERFMSGTQTAKGKRHNKEQTERENRNKETNCTYVLVMYELNIKESIRNTNVCKGRIRNTMREGQ
jgi:hypothetical protein